MINVMDDAVLEDAKAMSGIFLGAYEDKDLFMIEIMQCIKERGNADKLLTQIVVTVVLITILTSSIRKWIVVQLE